ncbi:MAG: rRNA maturation RNase YbeY [Pseudomonadota bacterium]
MNLAHEALYTDRVDDEGEAFAGPQGFRAEVRIDDASWTAISPIAICDKALNALVDTVKPTTTPARCDIIFSGDNALADLNQTFRSKGGATNVLSFPSGEGVDDDGVQFLGGVALAHGVCAREAAERDISLAHHATHLVVHGVLHLLGHDHEEEDARQDMEALEVSILTGLGIADPYGEAERA